MSEPQHPTPFGSHTGDLSATQQDGRTRVDGAASDERQAGPLDSLQAVGARLAQLRHAKAWSIDDVSARLKVSPQKLAALEEGDISHLPDRTFAAGIVRSYAKVLGADPTPFTQAFRRDGVPVEHNLKVPASSGAGLPRGRVSVPLGSSSGRKRSWLWGVAAIVVALVALAMWHTGGDSSVWLARLKSSATPAATSSDKPAASQVATPDEAAAANTGEASLPEVAAAPGEQPMPRPLGTNALPASSSTIAAVQGASAAAAASTVKAAPAAAAPASAAVASAPTVGSVGTGANAIELKVKEDSWFNVRSKDGKELFSGLVRAGSAQRVQGEAPFRVTVGNAKGVESLSIDDQPVDAKKYSGARGNVARLSLP
ncbi:helix-turn-helix domain-containing protein [Caballeronia sp. LZ016]|uniref:helix-turn-helix domain-containing protein n=1 Tax=Caballeronia sp. LZ016 TaxID=3038554 RepID=UPI002862630A|nr:helix-turn-helix domain-containing protein [Caballeronia sp. LZ016]MDR5738242.1 helix-turn-helix domain-containing protein [Caballeronia sp. LZ016]